MKPCILEKNVYLLMIEWAASLQGISDLIHTMLHY